MIKHKHHIIPKHMGGTDDPSNIVELSIEEHAICHKKLWEEHGKIEDWIAWQGLEGLITKKEILKQLCSHKGEKNPMFGKKGELSPNYGKKRNADQKNKISQSLKKHKRTEQHQKKLNERFTKEYLEKVTNSISREWKVTTPSGDCFLIKNMAEYCRNNNLNRGMVSSSAKYKKPYKGFLFEKLN